MNAILEPASTYGSDIIITPSTVGYVGQMEQIQREAYDIPADEPVDVLNADHFRRHLEIFPEGQFLALDPVRDVVVGTTTSMRMQFDLHNPRLEPWEDSIDYG